jgi:thiol-disulfide isomerase/thioredoxin
MKLCFMRCTVNICLLAIITLLFTACGGASSPEEASRNEESQSASLQEEQEQKEGPTYDVPFPVWSEAEELKQLFEQSNDTTYVINFWATWCKPCVKEMPYFEQLHEEMKNEKVRVILVSLDFDTDLESKMKPFVEERQLQSDVIAFINADYNSWIGEIEDAWDGAIPATIIYNANDRKFISGELDSYESLKATVSDMMKTS